MNSERTADTNLAVAAEIPLALYLHFPWCVSKCPYCDFNSHAVSGTLPEDAYIDALIRDLHFELADGDERRPLQSIFLGGGTPSLLSDRALGRALEAVAARLAFAPDIEITLEANPGTADASHFRGYRACGINRLSIGVQSLDDGMLNRLGRIHGGADVGRTVDLARAAGFDNLNLDLMFALPEQSEAMAAGDLAGAIAFAPEHLSYYQLTLEPNTAFASRPPPLPDDDTAWAIQQQGEAMLVDAGFVQYEVSAYARNGRRSRHNLNYWTFGDYLGIGAGAHGKRSVRTLSPAGDERLDIRRRARRRHPRDYLATVGTAAALQEDRRVPKSERTFEFMMNALRLNDGFPLPIFQERTGLDDRSLAASLRVAIAKGMIARDDQRVVPSALGRRYLNSLLLEFLDEK